MKEQSKIPTGKVKRASAFIKTGAKVGGNYLKHYTKKAFNSDLSKEQLHKDNAEDIFSSLGNLKGSVLKVVQMMSMDKNFLPKEYVEKFTKAQYSAPPLSYPLVVKTFRKYFGESPESLFDSFSRKAFNAASIGQVHRATLADQKLAVKIQYPGVGNSVSSDLKIARPIAVALLDLNEADLDQYMEEVETKLLEETDYGLELKRSMEISQACAELPGVFFPRYYPDYSCARIITMEWLDGLHLNEFLQTGPSQELRNEVGQRLWDFYQFQIHTLQQLHADPHPGNFLFRDDGTVGIIDFGCVKVLPKSFYEKYFQLINRNLLLDARRKEELFYELEFLHPADTKEEKTYFIKVFGDSIDLLGRPFYEGSFDFGDDAYFESIYQMGESLSRSKKLRASKSGRGSKHGLYLNRTYFGLYNILNHLKAHIKTDNWMVVSQ